MNLAQAMLKVQQIDQWPYIHFTDQELRNRVKAGLIVLLRQRFGGLDFWQLSKDWKELRYDSVAGVLTDIQRRDILHTSLELITKGNDNANYCAAHNSDR